MRETISVEKVDDVHMRVVADSGLKQELMQYFSFRPPNYQFVPSYKNKIWDGYVRLFNPFKPVLYSGLLDYLVKFCEDRDYNLDISDELKPINHYDEGYINNLVKELDTPLTPHDYQIEYILNAINNNRSLSISPTSSGKSFIIYLIQQHYFSTYGHRTLIIVPSIALVHQMASDFVTDYGCDASHIYKIQGGVDKKTSAPIVISTWQSLIKQPKEWFDQFKVVMGDEAHLFQAKSLTTIMEKLTRCPYRHGFTGTISSDSKIHKLVLEGLFGSIRKFVSTKELMDKGTVADFKIKAIVLNHSPETKKVFNDAVKEIRKKNKNTNKKINLFSMEKEFINNLQKRNLFLRNLVWSLEEQNNLILFDRVEKHGAILEPLLKKEGRILHYIHGGISGEDREKVRHIIENDNILTTVLHFNDIAIEIPSDEKVPLTDGSMRKAADITTADDVSEIWINSRISN